MKRWLMIVALMALMIVPAISAQLVYEKDTNFNLKIPCTFNNSYCSSSAVCTLTYIDPDTETLIDNKTMTNNGAYHNYSIVNTSETGIYIATIFCTDSGFAGVESFEILITPNGEIADSGKSLVSLAMLFGLLLFFAFSIGGIFYVKDTRGKFSLYWVTHLLAIAITFIAWQTASGTLSSTPFVGAFFRIIFFVVLIAFLPMFFIGIFFIIKFHFINKNVMELVNAGYSEEDAMRLAEKAANTE